MKNNTHREDRNFDSLKEKFVAKIYGSQKGRTRLAVIERDFEKYGIWNALENKTVLDAGGGFAPISQQLAIKGADVTVCDISIEMLQYGKELWQAKRNTAMGYMSFQQQSFQELTQQFDIVLCHAVIEWLEQPWQGIQKLVEQSKSGGMISLMIFNQPALIWRMVTFGSLQKVKEKRLSGFGNSFTPYHSFRVSEVQKYLEQCGTELVCISGIRIFSDQLRPEKKDKIDQDELLALELQYSEDPDFYHHARYLHFVVRKK